MNVQHSAPRPALDLTYPRSLGVYDDYTQAQAAVDHLADNEFPVASLAIVGTDLRSVERVTGRLTRGTAAAAGAMSGVWLGLFVGVVFTLFSRDGGAGALFTTPVIGAVFGLIWSQIGFSALTRGGTRDFSSVSQVVATRYELLVEHRLAETARGLLETLPAT